jgi:phosphoglycolate phosphatase
MLPPVGPKCDLTEAGPNRSPYSTISLTPQRLSTDSLQDVVVVFDLDGTLVDTAPDLIGSLNVLLEEEGLPLCARDAVHGLVGRGARQMIQRGFAEAGHALDEAEAPGLVARFIDIYLARIADESRPFAGALEATEVLTAAGARLAVCTNKRTDLSVALLSALGIHGRFAAVVGADSAPAAKPDPRHLTHTVAAAGGGRGLMVGDSNNDIDAARAAGLPSIAVSFGYTEIPAAELGADLVIDAYEALPEAVRRLLAG